MLSSMAHVFYSLMNLMLCVQREEAGEMNKRIESLPSFLLFLMVWNLQVNLSLLEQQTVQMLLTQHCEEQADWIERLGINRSFARSGDMVQNKLHLDASYGVGLPKQRKSYQSSPTFLCFESPTA